MSSVSHVLVFSLIGGAISLVGGLVLVRRKKTAEHLALYATPFAAGILLASAFSDLLPSALEQTPARSILSTALLGVVGFFFLERFLHLFHHHHEEELQKNKAKNSLIVIGDTLHNALDGIAIGAAFLIDVPTGVITSIAVAAHEIPQEIGDFGLLLKNGMQKDKVIVVNVISALATAVAAIATFVIGSEGDGSFVPYLLALTAGLFIYIATSDVIPDIHKAPSRKPDVRPWMLVLGVALMLLISPIAHDHIDVGHIHEDSVHHLDEAAHHRRE